jgi:hypothetical protein
VTATSGASAWAVGSDNGSCSCSKALILHWNGSSWKVALNSYASPQTFLTTVSASSASNAWAGGFTRASVNPTLLLHWNGRSWKRVAAGPKLSQAWGEVAGVAVTSKSNAWAAGMSATSSILRWNGTAWKKATTSTRSLDYAGMAATSAGNAWAVGSAQNSSATSVLIMHWNGTSWKRQAA